MRLMGLDVGEKTIGVAVSDELGLTAQGVTVIRRVSRKADLKALSDLVVERAVGGLVIGMPRNMDGSIGPKAREAQRFGEWVGEALSLPVEYADERLTTVVAQRALLEADVSRAKRRRVVDQLAAAIILQGHLDRHKHQG
ncbi:MAG: Holliday junction resolvase RuvX [Bacillota bacterium]